MDLSDGPCKVPMPKEERLIGVQRVAQRSALLAENKALAEGIARLRAENAALFERIALQEENARLTHLLESAPNPVELDQSAPWSADGLGWYQEDPSLVPGMAASGPWAEAALAEEASAGPVPHDPNAPKTTVIVRNLPSNFKADALIALLDAKGLFASYDFVYLPIDFNSLCSFGYAFVNFVDGEAAQRCKEQLEGFCSWETPCEKVIVVDFSVSHQGLHAHIERYRNSPVMSMPEELQPRLFSAGQRIAFPAPTKKLRAPRLRVRRAEATNAKE